MAKYGQLQRRVKAIRTVCADAVIDPRWRSVHHLLHRVRPTIYQRLFTGAELNRLRS